MSHQLPRSRNLYRINALSISAFLFTLLAATTLSARVPQSDQDALFNQAVDAYKQNQFGPALQKFQQVSGSHAQEAQQYMGRIKAYREAMAVAKGVMDRTPDERDASSLEYAIQQFQQAIKIKPDGPWQPADQLAKARELKAQVEKAHASLSRTMDSEFCAKALAAAQEHHYKEAAQYSCPLANDNPAYSCGGDEAVHMCQINTDMAKMEKPHRTSEPESSEPSSAFDKAKAAYDKNDFERARTLFERVDSESKSSAADFVDEISRYLDAMANGEKQGRAGQYDAARSAFLSAAAIKADGPGDPRSRATTMELFMGLDQFYSGDYASAIQHLQACAHAATQKQPLIRFYLGASELARYFVTGSEDSTLHEEALNDLKQAKQAGFITTNQDVSPKILQVYKDLTY